jgi:hypothetical protein
MNDDHAAAPASEWYEVHASTDGVKWDVFPPAGPGSAFATFDEALVFARAFDPDRIGRTAVYRAGPDGLAVLVWHVSMEPARP